MTKTISIIFVIISFTFCLSNSSSAITVNLVQTNSHATASNIITLEVVASGLGEYSSPSVAHIIANIFYDDTVFSLDHYELSNFLGDLTLVEAIDTSYDSATGSLHIEEFTELLSIDLDSLQPASFSLVTLYFLNENLAEGTSSISLVMHCFEDINGKQIDNVDGNAMITIIARPIPEPSSILLFFSGLAYFASFVRRRERIQIL